MLLTRHVGSTYCRTSVNADTPNPETPAMTATRRFCSETAAPDAVTPDRNEQHDVRCVLKSRRTIPMQTGTREEVGEGDKLHTRQAPSIAAWKIWLNP